MHSPSGRYITLMFDTYRSTISFDWWFCILSWLFVHCFVNKCYQIKSNPLLPSYHHNHKQTTLYLSHSHHERSTTRPNTSLHTSATRELIPRVWCNKAQIPILQYRSVLCKESEDTGDRELRSWIHVIKKSISNQ